MGTGGFGVDQAYLWYKRDGIQLDANVLVFAFIEDDFNRMQLPTFLARNPKPVILLDDKGSLSVHNVPVPTWGSHTKPWLVEFPRCTSTYIVTHRLISEWCYRHDTLAVACEAFDDLHRLSQEAQPRTLAGLPTHAGYGSRQNQRDPRSHCDLRARSGHSLSRLDSTIQVHPTHGSRKLFPAEEQPLQRQRKSDRGRRDSDGIETPAAGSRVVHVDRVRRR